MLFFFNDTATTEIYTLSLHDALPICARGVVDQIARVGTLEVVHRGALHPVDVTRVADRKSTRLNSSHSQISYAVFCLDLNVRPKRNNTPSQFHHVYTYSPAPAFRRDP